MHNSQAEDGSHSLVVSVRDSAPTNPQTRLPNAPLSREYQHQQRHSNLTELTGAGTWATNDGEEGRHNRVIGARLRNEIAQDTHSREQYHANIVEQEQCAVATTGVRSESNLKAKSPLKLVVQVSDDSTFGGADEFQDTDDDFSGLVHTPSDYNTSFEDGLLESERPYNDSLVLPTGLVTGVSSSALSVISDAGHQQQLRQKQAEDPVDDQKESICKRKDSFNPNTSFPPQFHLQDRIFNAMAQTRKSDPYIPDFGFLPRFQMYNVISPESVAAQLTMEFSRTHSPAEIERYTNEVCKETEVIRKGKKKLKTFQKIFAILVMVEMSATIPQFLEEDVSDLDLPLVFDMQHNTVVGVYRQDSYLDTAATPLRCLRWPVWSPSRLRCFQRDQWIMLAPFFSQGEDGEVKHYELQDQHVLPFVAAQQAEDDDAEYHGGFAKVMMVRIHPDHHNFKDKMRCDRGFAIKQLYENDRDSFRKEVSVLKKFSGARAHKHIVSLLATYEQRNKFHFIFHRAGGDLLKFWKELLPEPIVGYPNVLWVAQQCAGIAEGLMKLHRHLTFTIRHNDVEEQPTQKSTGERRVKIVEPFRFVRSDSMQSNGVRIHPGSPTWNHMHHYAVTPKVHDLPPDTEIVELEQFGRHGDINPGNILWFADGSTNNAKLDGTLKIADFGQAELNSSRSRTRPRSVANTMTYRPPECDIQPSIIRQSYDIWCLGCVYLEFVTWMLGGARMLTTFGEKRKSHDKYLNNDVTDTFFEFVSGHESKEVKVKIKPSVIKFIEELHRHPKCTEYFHDLLVTIQLDMLIVDSTERKSCDKIKQKLDSMYQRCCKEVGYASIRRPWSVGNKSLAGSSLRPVRVVMSEEAEQKIIENINANHAKRVLSNLQRRRKSSGQQDEVWPAPQK